MDKWARLSKLIEKHVEQQTFCLREIEELEARLAHLVTAENFHTEAITILSAFVDDKELEDVRNGDS